MSLASTLPLRTDVPAANPFLRRVHEATAALAAQGLRAAQRLALVALCELPLAEADAQAMRVLAQRTQRPAHEAQAWCMLALVQTRQERAAQALASATAAEAAADGPPPPSEVRLAATRAALEMAETMAVFNAKRAALGQPAIGLVMGVASGEVVAGHAGVPPHARLHCIGEPLRLALALQAHALANGHTLLVDAPTQTSLRGRVATEALASKLPVGTGGAPVAAWGVKTG